MRHCNSNGSDGRKADPATAPDAVRPLGHRLLFHHQLVRAWPFEVIISPSNGHAGSLAWHQFARPRGTGLPAITETAAEI